MFYKHCFQLALLKNKYFSNRFKCKAMIMSDYVKHVKGSLQHTAIFTALKITNYRSSQSDEHKIYNTQTRPWGNIQQNFTAVKMFIFR